MESFNIEEFISNARLVHGDRFDYSNSSYSIKSKKITIVCSIHGEFYQSPYSHIKGFGCKKCANTLNGKNRVKKFAATFIKRARLVHGEKYNYSKLEYINSQTKIEIICPSHGSFFQRPNGHTRGAGCPKCGSDNMANKQRMPLEEFLSKAYTTHGNDYDYTQVKYVSTHKHVTIVCPVHGPFTQTPSGHLSGRGCVYCAAKINADGQRSSASEFIERSVKVHGKIYDYSKVNYVNAMTPVEIICSQHGAFFQTSNKHILGEQGCPSCANRDMDTSKFIKRAKETHGEKYSYTNAVYTRAKNKIEIICSIHGSFTQRVDHHLRGIGCELCVDTLNSKGSQKVESWINRNHLSYEREKKFPTLVSKKSPDKKLRFDFYLPDLSGLIEFDGQQHFRPVSHWGGESAFKKTQKNDMLKTAWALQNGYKLVRISYLQINEIDRILDREFLT